jgi:hypothetical protein
LYQQEPDKADGLSPQQRKSMSPAGGLSKFGGIKIRNHLEELEFFKKKASTQGDKGEDMVHITKMTFIKYCVDLYKKNVQPMLMKLNRKTDQSGSPIQGKKPMGGSPQGRARRGNVLLNKDALKDLKGEGGSGDPNNFLSKLDVLRKRHGIQLLKINQLHAKDEEADAALDDTERERLIMEEEKYYENLDDNKIEDEEEQ